MSSQRPEETTEPFDPNAARPWDDLKSAGLLWLINTTVFHPRGFGLALVRQGGEIVGWRLLGDGSEPWTFAGVESGSCDGNFADVEALFAAHRSKPEPPEREEVTQ